MAVNKEKLIKSEEGDYIHIETILNFLKINKKILIPFTFLFTFLSLIIVNNIKPTWVATSDLRIVTNNSTNSNYDPDIYPGSNYIFSNKVSCQSIDTFTAVKIFNNLNLKKKFRNKTKYKDLKPLDLIAKKTIDTKLFKVSLESKNKESIIPLLNDYITYQKSYIESIENSCYEEKISKLSSFIENEINLDNQESLLKLYEGYLLNLKYNKIIQKPNWMIISEPTITDIKFIPGKLETFLLLFGSSNFLLISLIIFKNKF